MTEMNQSHFCNLGMAGVSSRLSARKAFLNLSSYSCQSIWFTDNHSLPKSNPDFSSFCLNLIRFAILVAQQLSLLPHSRQSCVWTLVWPFSVELDWRLVLLCASFLQEVQLFLSLPICGQILDLKSLATDGQENGHRWRLMIKNNNNKFRIIVLPSSIIITSFFPIFLPNSSQNFISTFFSSFIPISFPSFLPF